jgi:hypothetical protein
MSSIINTTTSFSHGRSTAEMLLKNQILIDKYTRQMIINNKKLEQMGLIAFDAGDRLKSNLIKSRVDARELQIIATKTTSTDISGTYDDLKKVYSFLPVNVLNKIYQTYNVNQINEFIKLAPILKPRLIQDFTVGTKGRSMTYIKTMYEDMIAGIPTMIQSGNAPLGMVPPTAPPMKRQQGRFVGQLRSTPLGPAPANAPYVPDMIDYTTGAEMEAREQTIKRLGTPLTSYIPRVNNPVDLRRGAQTRNQDPFPSAEYQAATRQRQQDELDEQYTEGDRLGRQRMVDLYRGVKENEEAKIEEQQRFKARLTKQQKKDIKNKAKTEQQVYDDMERDYLKNQRKINTLDNPADTYNPYQPIDDRGNAPQAVPRELTKKEKKKLIYDAGRNKKEEEVKPIRTTVKMKKQQYKDQLVEERRQLRFYEREQEREKKLEKERVALEKERVATVADNYYDAQEDAVRAEMVDKARDEQIREAQDRNIDMVADQLTGFSISGDQDAVAGPSQPKPESEWTKNQRANTKAGRAANAKKVKARKDENKASDAMYRQGAGIRKKSRLPQVIKIGRGIKKPEPKKYNVRKPNYKQFGIYLLNLNKLHENNIISLVYSTTQKPIPSLPQVKVSSNLIQVIDSILQDDFNNNNKKIGLTDVELRYLINLIKKSGCLNTDSDNLVNKYSLVMGEIVAGNDNPALINELNNIKTVLEQ